MPGPVPASEEYVTWAQGILCYSIFEVKCSNQLIDVYSSPLLSKNTQKENNKQKTRVKGFETQVKYEHEWRLEGYEETFLIFQSSSNKICFLIICIKKKIEIYDRTELHAAQFTTNLHLLTFALNMI